MDWHRKYVVMLIIESTRAQQLLHAYAAEYHIRANDAQIEDKNMNIGPGRLLNDLIERNGRQYTIPVYQRNYEWTERECKKLFDDIIEASRMERTHFCGSVVYALLEQRRDIDSYVVIDGQQRLTTVYILLKALVDCAESPTEKERLSENLFNKDKYTFYKIDESSKLKLKAIKSDHKQLMLLMDNRFEEMDEKSTIRHNYELFCSLIKEKLAQGLYIRDIYQGVELLTCALIRLDSDDNPQEIFENINSTGISLNLTDKIRNFVLMVDAKQETLFENYWLKLENLLTHKELEAFFSDYLNFKLEGFSKAADAYDAFKAHYKRGNYTNESMLKELLHYAEFYHSFLYADNTAYPAGANEALKSLHQLNQTTVFLFLFMVFDDFDQKVISESDLQKILQFLLNYSIRRIVCGVPSNSLRGLYKTLYNRVFYRQENKKQYVDALISFFLQLSSKDIFPCDGDFSRALRYNNLYQKNALCKYLLLMIENEGKEPLVGDNLTIEHILPQNVHLSSEWKNMLGNDWEGVREKYLHTLGNLTLTGYNSELSDMSFTDKKKKLREVNTKVVRLFADVGSALVWNADTIEERGEHLATIIIKRYPMPQPQINISFVDPRYHEYGLENLKEATHKIPNYYIFQGEQVPCKTFADMLTSFIGKLYELDEGKVETMAKNKESLFGNYPFFSYERQQLRRPETSSKIPNSEIYFCLNYSASGIVTIIAKLLDRFGIEANEFRYSAR